MVLAEHRVVGLNGTTGTTRRGRYSRRLDGRYSRRLGGRYSRRLDGRYSRRLDGRYSRRCRGPREDAGDCRRKVSALSGAHNDVDGRHCEVNW